MSKATWEDTPFYRRLLARLKREISPFPGFHAVDTVEAFGEPGFIADDDPTKYIVVNTDGYTELVLGAGNNSVDTYVVSDADPGGGSATVSCFSNPDGGAELLFAQLVAGKDASGSYVQLQLSGNTAFSRPPIHITDDNGGNDLFLVHPNGDVELGIPAAGVILTDSDGGKHRIKVATNGTLSTEAVT